MGEVKSVTLSNNVGDLEFDNFCITKYVSYVLTLHERKMNRKTNGLGRRQNNQQLIIRLINLDNNASDVYTSQRGSNI